MFLKQVLIDNLFKQTYNYYNCFPTNWYSIEYYKIIIFFFITFLICSLLIILAYIFSLTIIRDSEKLSEYECGFDPFDNATRQPFDVHFYIVGILFLIFDVEIAIIFPWITGLRFAGWFGFYSMTIFLIIITVGFFYEWHRGALIWPQNDISKTVNLR